MGFNTTVMLLNDRLNDIEKDPEFGRKLSQDVSLIGYPDAYRNQYYAKVIETHHNSAMSIVAVGHNMGITLGHSMIDGHSIVDEPEQAKIAMLKDLASQLGYRLVKSRRVK